MTHFESDAVILEMKQQLEGVDVYIDSAMASQDQTKINNIFRFLHDGINNINIDLSEREMSAHERENYNSLIDEINIRIERLRPYVTTGGRKKRKSRRRKSRRRKSRRS